MELATVVGERTPIVDRYLAALSRAPYAHLRSLKHRGAGVILAPTIADAFESRTATSRRGRELTSAELWDLRVNWSQRAQTVAAYDGVVDLLAFPTSYTTTDLERAVLHEVGHALTMEAMSPRPELLRELPQEISQRFAGLAKGLAPSDATRALVAEALADAYVFLLVGKAHVLPPDLLAELLLILHSESEEHGQIRFDFEADACD